jgi:putative peptide zinc metalloprotease protein
LKEYYLNGELKVHELESADSAQPFCIFVAGRSFYGTRQIACLLQAIAATSHPAQIAAAYNTRMGTAFGEAEISAILDKQLVPNGIVVRQAPQFQPPPPTKSVFFFSHPMFKPERVLALSKPLTWLYQPWRALALVSSVLVLLALWHGQLAAAGYDLISIAKLSPLTAPEICLLVALVAASFIAHELGHAAAAQHYNCAPAEIGIGLYLIFPAMFCNVSEIWRLPRLPRVVVNLGGGYFQLLFTGLLLPLQLLTDSYVLTLAIAISLLSMLMTLNPFLRFDGYWIYADWFRLPNLRAQSRRCLHSIVLKLAAGAAARGTLKTGPMPAALYAYAIGSILFFTYFAVYLLRQAGAALQFLGALPAALSELAGPGASAEGAMAVAGKAMISLLVLVGLLFILRLLVAEAVGAVQAWRGMRAQAAK